MNKPIKSILVSAIAPMSNHAANGGEKLLGNASSIKRRPDGRVYISGQMQRHALFSAIERLNWDEHIREGRVTTYVANGDGPSLDVKRDLRSDLGGYLDTNKGDYSGRRTAPITATPAVALRPSQVARDLLIRLKMNEASDAEKKQALATNEFSEEDEMLMHFFLDLTAAGIQKQYTYDKERHVDTRYERLVEPEERKRRARLFLEATSSLTDYAMQARFATSAEPQKVLIVLDTKLSRKAARYFMPANTDADEDRRKEEEKRKAIERRNILRELDARGAHFFFGDDTAEDGAEVTYAEGKSVKKSSVFEAYQAALGALEKAEIYDPSAPGAPSR
jgi:CRISPR-associated protein Cst2